MGGAAAGGNTVCDGQVLTAGAYLRKRVKIWRISSLKLRLTALGQPT
jgi:hypothetical protein